MAATREHAPVRIARDESQGQIGDGDLARAYRSTVDPRLNYEQALEVAMRIARYAQR